MRNAAIPQAGAGDISITRWRYKPLSAINLQAGASHHRAIHLTTLRSESLHSVEVLPRQTRGEWGVKKGDSGEWAVGCRVGCVPPPIPSLSDPSDRCGTVAPFGTRIIHQQRQRHKTQSRAPHGVKGFPSNRRSRVDEVNQTGPPSSRVSFSGWVLVGPSPSPVLCVFIFPFSLM